MLNYRAGDAAAFEALYQRHKGGVYRYILRQCRNESLAEELFQDVWMNLINARRRYTIKAKFSTWLYRIARNRIIDHFRRQHNPGNPGMENGSLDPDDLPGRRQDQPEQQVAIRDASERLFALIAGLPEEQRETFLLREEAGMSLVEIAKTTGVNTETAKSRLRYAVNKLRAGLAE